MRKNMTGIGFSIFRAPVFQRCAVAWIVLFGLQCPTKPLSADEKAPPKQLLATFRKEFVAIRPGTSPFPSEFQMGSSSIESAQPPRSVRIRNPFSMARYEVPQNLYEAVMGEDRSRWKGPRNSSEMMTWNEAVSFCKRATQIMRTAKLIAADEEIRLPSEAEWEYCCRAGSKTAYSFGDQAQAANDEEKQATLLDPYGWHTGNAAGNDPPVGALKPNAWGLYDMHGYLSEFVQDDWHDDYEGAPTDERPYVGRSVAKQTLVRGGSWRDHFRDLQSASRRKWDRDARRDDVGFRCVLSKSRAQ